MQLLSNVDPRDNLQKATRWELIDYARANGVDVPSDAPAIYKLALARRTNKTPVEAKRAGDTARGCGQRRRRPTRPGRAVTQPLDRLEQQPAVAERGDTEFAQVVRGQRQQ